jgi:hypothetical protein
MRVETRNRLTLFSIISRQPPYCLSRDVDFFTGVIPVFYSTSRDEINLNDESKT